MIHSTFKDFGGEAYHQHYPMQMFDRKLRPMDTLYVGLVCTKRVMDEQSRDRLVRQTPALRQKRDDHARANPSDSEAQANEAALPATVQSFYTFHFAPFSSNQAWLPSATADYNPYTGDYDGVEEVRVHELGYAEPSAKKAKKHYEEAKRGETYDPYIGPARREFEGMVGAWRIGKVLDTSAQKRDQYTGGPVDTTTAVTVNVCLEFMDWRALRRSFDRADIGMRAPGARPWIDEGKIGNVRAEEERRRLRDNDTTPVSAFEAQRIALNRPLSSFAPMPTRVDLEGRQSQEGNGHTAPAPGSLARVKWDAWLTFLYTQNRQLALQRIDTNARAMDAAAYSAEIDALVESMASMTDDGAHHAVADHVHCAHRRRARAHPHRGDERRPHAPARRVRHLAGARVGRARRRRRRARQPALQDGAQHADEPAAVSGAARPHRAEREGLGPWTARVVPGATACSSAPASSRAAATTR